ncbi:hypothetical protein [Parasediminibacterium sp. JCM 36343]|uniref:hypothetical protein n=1 Tax=Parasediminibacterium sp. JCM 36343 TaxID=3374279 RepID=UPI00397C4B3A
MKFIKLGFISFFIFFLMATVLGLVFPSIVVVSRAIDIGVPKDSVYRFIKDINGWKKWMDGINDSTAIIESPLKAHIGRSEIIISPTHIGDSIVNATWATKNNGIQESSLQLFQEKGQANTVVHWQFVQHIKWYPWERFASMMSDKIMGTMMEKNLNHLKEILDAP